MKKKPSPPATVGEAYLAALDARGVEYLFGNAGTDFPAIIEGLAKARLEGKPAPSPITVPHENVAVSMAHGYYLGSGRPQAVMLHVNVGTANGICALLNASRDNIPMLFCAGRTPITEAGTKGARSVFIHWAQEMFDQAGMVREIVKWDYELRRPEQVDAAVGRALDIAMSEPRGPVYLTLPREVLASPAQPAEGGKTRTAPASPPAPDPKALEQAAGMIAMAKAPVIVASSYGRTDAGVAALGDLAQAWAIPVVNFRPRRVALETSHPMHVGFESARHIAAADVIVVIDADVPWIPALHKIKPGCAVIHIGADPLFAQYPMRSFPCDLAITAQSELAVAGLMSALGEPGKKAADTIATRRKTIAGLKAEQARHRADTIAGFAAQPNINSAMLAHALNQVKRDGDVILCETQFPFHMFDLNRPGSFFGGSPAGGLGWGLGAALGYKLARPEARVIALTGDGSYMFGNPTPAHFVAQAYNLPTLTIISNNRMWGAVRKATLGLYPEGAAARINDAPLTMLEPAPDYEKVVAASGGYGEKVERKDDLVPALERAFNAVEKENRAAVLNVLVEYSDADASRDATR